MAPRHEPEQQRPLQRPPPNPRLLSVQSIASKYSIRSHSSSFEADDEHSTTTAESIGMSPRPSLDPGDMPPSNPRYPGEDTRPTSNKELSGWYMYSFAAETYVICGKSGISHPLLNRPSRNNGISLTLLIAICK